MLGKRRTIEKKKQMQTEVVKDIEIDDLTIESSILRNKVEDEGLIHQELISWTVVSSVKNKDALSCRQFPHLRHVAWLVSIISVWW